ncbi:hypothetical protein FHG87_022058 [Trinorchestia longiramus]|nr:hypothetical protein FHG87_022058 [Trinorchestia longiramus]
MSSDLRKYLLTGAPNPANSGPQEGSNLALALRRHAHAYAHSRPARNRHSLDLDSSYVPGTRNEGQGSVPGVRYRGAVSDLSTVTNRRSLDLDKLANARAREGGRHRTVTFDFLRANESSYPSYVEEGGKSWSTESNYPRHSAVGDSKGLYPTAGDREGLLPHETPTENSERNPRSRRRRREEESMDRDDSVEPGEVNTGASPQLERLVQLTPTSYAEAQRLKKMLKRAVSGPNATFEDLKLYRTGMKKLRRIVKEEQEKEITRASEEYREQQQRNELSSTSPYGASRYGGAAGSSYLSVLRPSSRDQSGSRENPGYVSGGSGYSSGTNSRPSYTANRLSTDYGSKGISAMASKFGETKSSRFGATSPQTQTSTPALGRSRFEPTPSPASSLSTTSGLSQLRPRASEGKSGSALSINSTATTPPDPPVRRREAFSSVSNSTPSTTPSYSRTRSGAAASTATSTASSTLPRTRSRETTIGTSSTTFESPSTYTPRCRRESTFDKSGYNSGYGSDARSGYGSDCRSGYNSSTNYTKYNSYSRSNSTLKDGEYKPTYSRENSSFKPYSRENSFLSSDGGGGGGGGGSSWRSRVYGTETDKAPENDTTYSTNNNTNNRGSLDTTVFRDAIDKLAKAAKDETEANKKPEGVSPNAVRVLPIFSPGDVKLKNKAPADFTSASEASDAEEDNKKSEETSSKAISGRSKTSEPAKIDISPSSTTTSRPFRHLAAVAPLPSKPSTISTGLAATPTFKLSSRFANANTEALPVSSGPSKWLRNREEEKQVTESHSKSPSPYSASATTVAAPGNKDCRKSVLNMDIINPADQELMRKQQEEKREELRRLRRQRGEEGRTTPLTKTGKAEDTASPGSPVPFRGTDKLTGQSPAEEEQHQSSDENKSEKPPVAPPSIEKTSSKTRVIERKHSKGKSDSLRRSGSFRRTRDRHSSLNSKSSSSSSSESEGESPLSKARNSSFSRRRRGSRDDVVGSSGDSRPGSRVRSDLPLGKRSRNNSESHSKNNSKSNISKSISGEKSRNGSRSNVIEASLSLGPDIDTGEATYTFTLGKKGSNQTEESATGVVRTKDKKEAEPSSESESSKSSESSESGSEEGHFFSLSKSKSSKRSRSSCHKIANALNHDRSKTSIGSVSCNNSSANVNTSNMSKDQNGVVSAQVTITLPRNNAAHNSDEINKDQDENTENGNNEGYQEFQWPSGSPELPRKKNEVPVAQQNGYEEFRWPSKSPEPLTSKEAVQNTHSEFQWPDGSPEFPRRKPPPIPQEQQDGATEEFRWPSRSPELPQRNADSEEVNGTFQWPDGSPEMPRKRDTVPSFMKTQWDTETETEMTEMEQTEWSDGSPKSGRKQMPQVTEETEEEFNFEWPSSPEMSRRHPYLATQCSGYDTQNEMENFEWGSSPELPVDKDERYVTVTRNIDELINDDQDKIEDDFDELEKLYGFEASADSERTTSNLTSRRSSKISEKILLEDENGEKETEGEDEMEEEDDEKEEEKEEEEDLESSVQESIHEEEKRQTKESLKDRARNNLSLFLGKLTNIDDIVSTVLKPLTSLPSIKRKTSSQVEQPLKLDVTDQHTQHKEDASSEDGELHNTCVCVLCCM